MKMKYRNLSLFYTNWAACLHILHFGGCIPSTQAVSNIVCIIGTGIQSYNHIKHNTKIKDMAVGHILHFIPPILFYLRPSEKPRNIKNEYKMFITSGGAYLIYITFVCRMNIFKIYENVKKINYTEKK